MIVGHDNKSGWVRIYSRRKETRLEKVKCMGGSVEDWQQSGKSMSCLQKSAKGGATFRHGEKVLRRGKGDNGTFDEVIAVAGIDVMVEGPVHSTGRA